MVEDSNDPNALPADEDSTRARYKFGKSSDAIATESWHVFETKI